MFKVLIQGVIIIALFFCTWLSLSTINWVTIFKIEHLTNVTEEKLGDIYWDMIKSNEKEIQNIEVTLPLDSILSKICISNNIDKNIFKLHVIESDEINAFALGFVKSYWPSSNIMVEGISRTNSFLPFSIFIS